MAQPKHTADRTSAPPDQRPSRSANTRATSASTTRSDPETSFCPSPARKPEAPRRGNEHRVVRRESRDERRVPQRGPRETETGEQKDYAVELGRVDVDPLDAPEQAEDQGREDGGAIGPWRHGAWRDRPRGASGDVRIRRRHFASARPAPAGNGRSPPSPDRR